VFFCESLICTNLYSILENKKVNKNYDYNYANKNLSFYFNISFTKKIK